MDMEERARQLLHYKHYGDAYPRPQQVCEYNLNPPDNNQYILRMLVKAPHTPLLIPDELKWVENLILRCQSYQRVHFLEHPFLYVTVRHGPNIAEDDDVWHVDGFSMRIPHLPEQNYLWSNTRPTEFSTHKFVIPDDFCPFRHNIHSIFQQEKVIHSSFYGNRTITVMDPYIVHRRPQIVGNRTFVRVSFVPILVEDDDNTQNPLIPVMKFGRVGKQIRDQLDAYIHG